LTTNTKLSNVTLGYISVATKLPQHPTWFVLTYFSMLTMGYTEFLLPHNQSAYCKWHSTETTMLCVETFWRFWSGIFTRQTLPDAQPTSVKAWTTKYTNN